MSSPSLKLKPNVRARVLTGHPWVFANEVESLLPASLDGEVVECRDRTNRQLGSGIYNSKSQILWRRLSRGRAVLDADWIRQAVKRAVARRAFLQQEAPRASVGRIIWSESDDLPGLVVDRFEETLVVQIHTLALEKRRDLVAQVLQEELAPEDILFRHDAPIRRLEGLPLEVFTASGRAWEARWLKIDDLDYWIDLQGGQKTGFYLDQRRQHLAVARYCDGKSVLDAFCNQGAFGLHAARAGASRVLGLDSAAIAINAARRNAERNSLAATFEVTNVFDWFNQPARTGEETWDVIILDPPPFAKSRAALQGAMRGYKEINLRAMQRLAPGGVLATYSCSHHMQDVDFRGVLAAAAADARRKVRVLEFCHQPPDHPVLVTMPESEYLRGYILQVE